MDFGWILGGFWVVLGGKHRRFSQIFREKIEAEIAMIFQETPKPVQNGPQGVLKQKISIFFGVHVKDLRL